MGGRVGFLHTADIHVATFGALVDRAADGSTSQHVVDASLLDDARDRGGVDHELRGRLLDRLAEAAQGCDVVVCTCSTLSGATEAMGEAVGVPVVRVDRPLARLAVSSGPRIAVIAALASTLGPTTDLLLDEAARAGATVELTEVLVADAWEAFEQGDQDAYLTHIAGAARSVDAQVDVIVLAQASMAAVTDQLDLATPVLAGPALAVDEALRIARSPR